MPGFLSELSPEKEKKQFGFTVYDAETGMPMPYQDLYKLDGNYGGLHFGVDNEDFETVYIPREGKYIIFFSDCSWMRY